MLWHVVTYLHYIISPQELGLRETCSFVLEDRLQWDILAILSHLLLPFVMACGMAFSFAKLAQVVQGCS